MVGKVWIMEDVARKEGGRRKEEEEMRGGLIETRGRKVSKAKVDQGKNLRLKKNPVLAWD